MSFPTEILSKEKQNHLQKCFYMMNLIKNKNNDIWEMYAPVFENLQIEESWEFYLVLVDEYQKILAFSGHNKIVRGKKAKKAA